MDELFTGTFEELDRTERHIMVLKATKDNQPVGIIRLSEITGLPKHLVRYSLRRLEQDGLIIPTKDGATVSPKYSEFMDSGEEAFEEEDADIVSGDIRITRTKHFGLKPMYPEDACIEMELLGHNFFVFRNAETDEVNVVYKRKKQNTYGLIEPEF